MAFFAATPAAFGQEAADGIVLGAEDLAERGEIARNAFRRITPGDEPFVQDVGTWPAAWEEFSAGWASAAAVREYGAWVVPVEVAQEDGATVIRDANGAVLWRGGTDFAKPESAGVTLVGGLVAEEDWDAYEVVRDFANFWQNQGEIAKHRQNASPPRGTATNGLRFTSVDFDTNGTVQLSLAWEEDGEADIFAYAIPHDPGVQVFTWTNDENQVVTVTNTVWTMAGENLSGFGNDWEWRGTATVTNGEGLFVDAGFPAYLGRIRFYAAAEANDTDGDGLNDGFESFVHHTDPENTDSDGDGVPDGTDPYPATSNVFWVVTTTNEYSQRYGMGNCPSNAPAQKVVTVPVTGAAPTDDSVVQNVTVTGFVDDGIKVDDTGIDWRRDVHAFNHRCITNEIKDLQSRHFNLELWDWPRADYAGPNEARFGDTNSVPFRVEWTWKVPVCVTIEGAWSEQFPGRECNSLLVQDQMYMATRSDDMGYVSVAASVQPPDAVGMAMVGVMHGTDVLSSACIQKPKTLLEFAPVGGRESYSVVGGFDMDGDGILQATEVSVACPNRLVLLRQSAYNHSSVILRSGAGITWGVASQLLDAFLDGTIPSNALATIATLDSESLTHPLGASWDGNCTASTSLYLYPEGTDVAEDVAEDDNLVATVTNSLAGHSDDVAAWFAVHTDGTHDFGPWDWHSNGLEFDGAALHFGFGHVNATGTVSATVRRSDFAATRIVYDGYFTDIYDFSYTGPFPSVYGATVQAGFPTLGTAGRVFKVRVEFSRDTTAIDFRFNPE